MSGDYLFTSARLGYRLCQASDYANLLKLDTDPEVRSFFPMGVATPEEIKTRTQKYQDDFAERGYGIFIMEELTTGEFVGRCGFGQLGADQIEVGYVLMKKFWGKGFASEALAALLEWANTHMTIDSIIAFAPINHLASQRVMQKCGMQFEKTAEMYGVECAFYKISLRDGTKGKP